MIKLDNKILEVKQKSLMNKISTIRDLTAELLIKTINDNNCKNILEIGTGFGYSSLLILNNCNIKSLITIEKSEERFIESKKNLSNHKNICIINDDCKKIKFNNSYLFDFIFLDGPKAGQENIIINLINNISNNGIIFVDNIYLKKIRENLEKKDNIKLIKKLDIFIDWIKQNDFFDYEFVDIDDGVAILKRKI